MATLPPPTPPPPPYLLSVAKCTTVTATFAPRSSITGVRARRISKHQQLRTKTLNDYFQQSTDLLTNSDGGPPRWFSPLECASRFNNSPLLLTLPGIDGTGLSLILHHQRLGEIFDIWCLHIPTTDRTPFADLVKMVERTVRSENEQFPNRPIYLVGESMGACLALAVAARTRDIDLVLVLANPATSFDKSQLQPFIPFWKMIPDQLPLGLPYVLALITEKGLPLQQTVADLSDVAALFSYLSGLADVLTVEMLLWKLEMVESAYEYSNSRIHNVTAQTLVLSSGNDQLLPGLQEGQRIRRILPNCQIRTFNKFGHALFLEEGFDLVTVIKGAGFYRRAKHIDYVFDFLPPSPLEIRNIIESFRWLDLATSPVILSTLETGKIVRGLDGIPSEGPVLFVGYHNILSLELLQMLLCFIIERNIIVRVLGHPLLFKKLKEGKMPDLASYDILRVMGVVPVSASNMYKLFSIKSHVLLYPGGVRERLHRKGEEYKLFWPEQPEFVRIAATCGAKIIPFGAVGEDDYTQLVLDYNDQMKIPFLKAYNEELTNETVKLRTDAVGELANQDMHFPGVLPKVPGRYYYLFRKSIETHGRKQELRDKETALEVYLQVKSEVEKCLAYCIRRREDDPYRNIIPRFIYQVTHGGLDSQVPTFHIH